MTAITLAMHWQDWIPGTNKAAPPLLLVWLLLAVVMDCVVLRGARSVSQTVCHVFSDITCYAEGSSNYNVLKIGMEMPLFFWADRLFCSPISARTHIGHFLNARTLE